MFDKFTENVRLFFKELVDFFKWWSGLESTLKMNALLVFFLIGSIFLNFFQYYEGKDQIIAFELRKISIRSEESQKTLYERARADECYDSKIEEYREIKEEYKRILSDYHRLKSQIDENKKS